MKNHRVSSVRTGPGPARLAALLGGGALAATLALLPAAPCLGAQVNLAWDAVADGGGSTIQGYTVHVGRASGAYDDTVDVGLATATTLPNLEDGAVYFIAVSAYDQFGQGGALSSEVVFSGADGDSDGDGLPDVVELAGCTSELDGDSDEDGIPDGVEDADLDGLLGPGETDPCALDTDGDGLQDGTELGYTLPALGTETAGGIFQPDLDPGTVTDPLNPDTDGDGLADGREDANGNGALDAGETDPLVADPVLLFADTFEDGGAAGDPDWTPVSGVWSVTEQGAYVAAAPFNNLTLADDPALQALAAGRIETRVRLPRRAVRAPNAFVVFNRREDGSYRYVRLTPGRIAIGQVGDFPGESGGVKATRKFKIRKNRWYRLRVDFDAAGAVAVHVNGRVSPALTADFATAEPGGLGYQARKSETRFDDLAVWSDLILP